VAIRAFVRDDLTGRLVAPIDVQVSTPGACYLAYPPKQACRST
jgi:hypothetical protein